MTRLPIRKLNLIGYADRPLQRGLGSHPMDQGGGSTAPVGFTWTTTSDGQPVYNINGLRVFDDGHNFYVGA